jgi:gas vesicle protein
MGSFGSFLGGLLVGAAAGAAIIFFTAPQTGDETRSSLTQLWNSALDTGKRVAKEREAELWTEFNVRVKSDAGPSAV